MLSQVFISLGSNLGNRANNLEKAIEKVKAFIGGVVVSSLYETEPMYVADQPKFLNAVMSGYTMLEPEEILARVKAIEAAAGKHVHNQPRAIDIDILFLGHEVVDTPELVIPHPRMEDRAFVLVPLAEIAPDYIHPTLGVSISVLLKELGKISGVQKV